jgi:hypothetical protein
MRKGLFAGSIVLIALTSICFADAVPDIREGQWEITTKVEIPGMPANMPPMKNTQCLTNKDFVPKNSQPGQECSFPETKITGNTVTYKMECKGKQGEMKGSGEITYSGDSFKGTMKMQMPQANMEMISHMEGKRIGDCK